MTIELPKGIEVDPYNLPDDFENQIKAAFTDYTMGTADAYTFQDKLCFIDHCIEDCHGAKDSDDIVMADLKNCIGHDIEYGDFPEKDEYFSFDRMVYYYNMGKESQRLYSHDFGGKYSERRREEAIEKMLISIMAAVLDWEAEC